VLEGLCAGMAGAVDAAFYLEWARVESALAFEGSELLGVAVEALEASGFLVLACDACEVAGWKF
jgi:hypothetical protein